MIRTLGLVSAVCGLIIVGAYQGTYDAVAANKRLALGARGVQGAADGEVDRQSWQATPAAASKSRRGRDGDSAGRGEVLRRLR
jgi:electron transport complex protein RnfG